MGIFGSQIQGIVIGRFLNFFFETFFQAKHFFTPKFLFIPEIFFTRAISLMLRFLFTNSQFIKFVLKFLDSREIQQSFSFVMESVTCLKTQKLHMIIRQLCSEVKNILIQPCPFVCVTVSEVTHKVLDPFRKKAQKQIRNRPEMIYSD